MIGNSEGLLIIQTKSFYKLKVDNKLSYSRKLGETVVMKKEDMVSEGIFENGDAA
jgi:hypothetical protein